VSGGGEKVASKVKAHNPRMVLFMPTPLFSFRINC
jgi:hypothetical protein